MVDSSKIDSTLALYCPVASSDTAFLRTSDQPLLPIMGTVSGVPSNGMQIYFHDPVTGINDYVVTADSGRAWINVTLRFEFSFSPCPQLL